jgi:hypothetical protein
MYFVLRSHMNKYQLYELSRRLNEVVQQAKVLLGTHGARYKHFVDGSDRGHDCTYAVLTAKYFDQEKELQGLQSLLEGIVREAEAASALLKEAEVGKDNQ